ncbi:uncharacterized protein [Euphorbia lathyris]|uniref:uncharacterized protein n=1 Tax=Euphorbia lathyris TaxID=212925 RepID=UPI0033135D7B
MCIPPESSTWHFRKRVVIYKTKYQCFSTSLHFLSSSLISLFLCLSHTFLLFLGDQSPYFIWEKPKFSVDLGLSLGGFPWESSGEEREASPRLGSRPSSPSKLISWAIDSASRSLELDKDMIKRKGIQSQNGAVSSSIGGIMFLDEPVSSSNGKSNEFGGIMFQNGSASSSNGSVSYGRRYQCLVLVSTSYERPTAEMIMFEDILNSSWNKRPADGIKVSQSIGFKFKWGTCSWLCRNQFKRKIS